MTAPDEPMEKPARPVVLFVLGMGRSGTSALTRDGAIARMLSDPAASDHVAVERVWSVPAPPPASASSAAAPAPSGSGGSAP